MDRLNNEYDVLMYGEFVRGDLCFWGGKVIGWELEVWWVEEGSEVIRRVG